MKTDLLILPWIPDHLCFLAESLDSAFFGEEDIFYSLITEIKEEELYAVMWIYSFIDSWF